MGLPGRAAGVASSSYAPCSPALPSAHRRQLRRPDCARPAGRASRGQPHLRLPGQAAGPARGAWRPGTAPAAAAAAADAAGSGAPEPAGSTAPPAVASAAAAPPKGLSSLGKRVVFGIILGFGAAAILIAGGWVFAATVCLAAFQCSQEYLGLVNAKGISKGMKPPPPIVSSAISLLCVALNAWTFISGGRSASAMAVATFAVLSLQLLTASKPRFSQLASAVFGLLYCGYLPSFWLKLRLMAVPALNTTLLHGWPEWLGGLPHVTVGLCATFTAVAVVIAADTGAYFVGKALGRTQLTRISPKKTVEGAIGGLLCSIAAALGCRALLAWPEAALGAAALGTIVFFASLFGDLIESVIKRDAGLKDASNLIPGHGGLLDRLDSYIFTGACVYFYVCWLGAFGV